MGWSAALGLVAFFCAMSRCPLAAFFLGCEIFGWQGAPLFAIVTAISFLLGGDVGYYGRGATSVVRDTWYRSRHGEKRALSHNGEKREVSAPSHDAHVSGNPSPTSSSSHSSSASPLQKAADRIIVSTRDELANVESVIEAQESPSEDIKGESSSASKPANPASGK